MNDRNRAASTTNRTEIIWRVVLAIPVGYVITNMTVIALGILLPVARADAAQTGLLGSFLVYALIAIRAFSPATVKRVCAELLVLFVVSGLVIIASSFMAGVD